MIRHLWNKIGARSKHTLRENGKKANLSPVESLEVCTRMLLRLARQIESHAAQAPYPYLTQRLQGIALEKQQMVNVMKVRLSRLDRDFATPDMAVRSGKNHWERMQYDLEDQKSLEDEFMLHAARSAESAPEISELLKETALQQSSHRESLLDIAMRADPQAHQT